MDTNVPVEAEFDSSDGLSDEDWTEAFLIGNRMLANVKLRTF